MPSHDPQPPAPSRPGVYLLGAVLVPLFYLLLAWVVGKVMGEEALIPIDYRLASFGILCAVALGACLLAFRGADAWRERPVRWIGGHSLGGVVALCLAETPAFCGLVYFILFRHHIGLYLLVALSAATFVALGAQTKA